MAPFIEIKDGKETTLEPGDEVILAQQEGQRPEYLVRARVSRGGNSLDVTVSDLGTPAEVVVVKDGELDKSIDGVERKKRVTRKGVVCSGEDDLLTPSVIFWRDPENEEEEARPSSEELHSQLTEQLGEVVSGGGMLRKISSFLGDFNWELVEHEKDSFMGSQVEILLRRMKKGRVFLGMFFERETGRIGFRTRAMEFFSRGRLCEAKDLEGGLGLALLTNAYEQIVLLFKEKDLVVEVNNPLFGTIFEGERGREF